MNEGERSSGVVIGKVTAVKDPTKLGQIQVTYPWLSGPRLAGSASPRRWRARTAAFSACPGSTTR